MSRSNHRDRNRRRARGSSGRERKQRILVVTEGEVTEPGYFRGFQSRFRQTLIEIQIEPTGRSSLAIVQYAKSLQEDAIQNARRMRDENLRFDEVWCVFDVDDHRHLAEARQMAEANDVHLAVSNPSVELWLLLHFVNQPPGETHRDEFRRRLKEYQPHYDKHVRFDDYSAGYSQAVEHAKKLDGLADDIGEPGRNPTTGVYRLTERIRLGHGG